jgi:hypothetical protein
LLSTFVFLAALAAQPSPRLTDAELRACLDVSDALIDRAAIGAAKAELSAAEWNDVCRQARDANDRRLSVARTLRATGDSPVGGHSAVTTFLAQAAKATDPDVSHLFRLAANDQIARGALSSAGAPTSKGLSPLARKLYDGLVSFDAIKADRSSREWLRETVAWRGWFTIDRDGRDADWAALLIVQHADADLAFKHEMLVLLEPLALVGRSRTSSFPQMYERWAIAAKAPQRFGLNGACKAPGVWEPYPIEDLDRVDQRRQAFGITQPLAEHVRQMGQRCA